jgi:hypothetical protein
VSRARSFAFAEALLIPHEVRLVLDLLWQGSGSADCRCSHLKPDQ